jgi:HAD superfamily hydrolase (TIGR01549 family)
MIFDWSGVISDDRLPVYESNMLLLKHYGKPRITFDEWLPKTTLSVREFGPVYGIEVDPDYIFEQYRKTLNQVRASGIHPTIYKEAKSVLEKIFNNGNKLAVVSSHPEQNLHGEAREYGVEKYFSSFTGNSKDKTETILKICKEMGVSPSRETVVYIGDTIYDVRAAKGAGVYSISVTNGYHAKDRLEKENPDKIIESLSELI